MHVLLYSYLPRSTHAVGAAVGQPDAASQQSTLPAVVGAIVVVVGANLVSVSTWVCVTVVERVWVCVEVEFPTVSTDNEVEIVEDTDRDRDVNIDVEVDAVVSGIAVSKTQVLLAEHPHGLSSIDLVS